MDSPSPVGRVAERHEPALPGEAPHGGHHRVLFAAAGMRLDRREESVRRIHDAPRLRAAQRPRDLQVVRHGGASAALLAGDDEEGAPPGRHQRVDGGEEARSPFGLQRRLRRRRQQGEGEIGQLLFDGAAERLRQLDEDVLGRARGARSPMVPSTPDASRPGPGSMRHVRTLRRARYSASSAAFPSGVAATLNASGRPNRAWVPA